MRNFVIRLLVNALALWAAATVVSGITLSGGYGEILIVALIFGILNAVLKPILVIFSIPFLIITLGLFALIAPLAGCTVSGPDRLEIEGRQYPAAYDAALEATRRAGMPAIVSDRAGGAIEGRPRLAGSVVEPWRVDNSSGDQWVENTLHKQRRRVRFEFLPVDFASPEPSGEDDLLGPPLPGSGEDLVRTVDLVGFDVDEVRQLARYVVVQRSRDA